MANGGSRPSQHIRSDGPGRENGMKRTCIDFRSTCDSLRYDDAARAVFFGERFRAEEF